MNEDLQDAANSESVADWEAEKLEPLRREVAMLLDVLEEASSCTDGYYIPLGKSELECVTQARNHTQATAEAYEREIKAMVINDCKTRALQFLVVNDKSGIGWVEAADLISAFDEMENKLRAANKGKE